MSQNMFPIWPDCALEVNRQTLLNPWLRVAKYIADFRHAINAFQTGKSYIDR